MDPWNSWDLPGGTDSGPGSAGWPAARPQRNFWGDLDGDGRETRWDDVLGDAILSDALAAYERRRRGLPPDPEDEELIGPADFAPARRRAATGGTEAGAVVVALVFAGLGLAWCACLASTLSSF